MSQQKKEKLIHGISALFLFLFFFVSPSYFYAASTSQAWTLRGTEMNGYWASVVWSPSLHLFAAVGHNTVMTSPDGMTWTSGTMPSGEWNAITWSPERNMFVVVGFGHAESGNDVVTSSDGIVWTSQTTPAFTPIENPTPGEETSYGMWNSVVWSSGRGLFVAVGQNFTNSSNESIMTSPDGVVWSFQNNVIDAVWTSVTWAPSLGRFVAVGYDNRTISSSDGITWDASLPIGSVEGMGEGSIAGGWRSISWSPELALFVAVSEQLNERVTITSADGISWTPRAGVTGHYDWQSITWSPELGIFTAVSVSNAFMTSPDGVTWTDITPPANKPWSSIAWSPELGIFVVVANSGHGVSAASSDKVIPLISAVSSGTPDAVTATITWATDISADTQVHYGTTSEYGSFTALNSALTVSHSATLTGLTSCTEYHYQARSSYAGESGLSSDGTFTTAGCPLPPTVTTTAANAITSSGATLTATITETGGSTVTDRGFYYGLTSEYGQTSVENGSFDTGDFSYTLTGLSSNTTYHYRAYATNSAGTVMSDGDMTFTTNTSSGSSGGGALVNPVVPIAKNAGIPPQTVKEKKSVVLFAKTFRKGMTHEEILMLQKFLNTHGYGLMGAGPGSNGNETNFFGSLTEEAVSRFQTDYAKEILAPLLLQNPTGIFGSNTLKTANEILVKESSR